MRFLWVLMKPSAYRVCTFLLCTIVHSPFDAPKSALAQPPPPGPDDGPDGSWIIPLRSDYPIDDEIARAYIDPGPDMTALEVDGSDDGDTIEQFCHGYGTNWLRDCFPEGSLFRNGRSDRWYLDFWYRFNVIFLQKAQGVVYMLSRKTGPRPQFEDCDFWYEVQFPTLKANRRVTRILAVNDQHFDDQWIYWKPGDERPRTRDEGKIGEDESELGDVGNRPSGDYQPYEGDENYGGGNVMNAFGGALGAGLTGASGLLRAVVGGPKPPTVPPGGATKEPKDQPDTGTKTDVINLNIGALPDSPVGIDGESTVGAVNPTWATDYSLATAFFPSNDDTSSGGLQGISNIETSLNLFGRGRRIMQRRAVTASCLAASLFDDPRNPDFPSRRRESDVFKISATVDKFVGQIYKWIPGELATVQITQHKKQSGVYHINISFLDPNRNVIFSKQQIVVQTGKEIAIDTQRQLNLLNLLLYVKVENGNEEPIYFRYGGDQWSSSDPPFVTGSLDFKHDHHCVTEPQGPWDEKRQIRCRFSP
ncbi:hypothetical protein MMC07_003233 [Pseudocyphellaria aurata]|nr:hypothetical protein [Pseudocyphellaria aurata]